MVYFTPRGLVNKICDSQQAYRIEKDEQETYPAFKEPGPFLLLSLLIRLNFLTITLTTL